MTGQWGAVELAVEPMHCCLDLFMSLVLCEHYLCMMHSHSQGLFVVHLRPGQGPATMQGWGLPMHSMQQRFIFLRLPQQATAEFLHTAQLKLPGSHLSLCAGRAQSLGSATACNTLQGAPARMLSCPCRGTTIPAGLRPAWPGCSEPKTPG